ncbi:MAG: hypothetical protein QX198_14725 [Methylococcaceae bacterium]
MLIRISGGVSGIKEYLENGQKHGREYSRDELDERVILEGDIELTNTIINNMNNAGDKYLHITLAFKEDEINRETLEAITMDFKEFAFSAFQEDEYSFYAEAHLPRIKGYANQKTGEFVERKPHIHIVIPKYNLLSGESLNPFGLVSRQVKFLEAFQEATNAKYGLASPKDNRRGLFTEDSELISRYKGDHFTGSQKDLKEAILSVILTKEIINYDDFKKALAEYGQLKIRNEGKANEYLWVKAGDGKGINLRDIAFTREFIELSTIQKRQRLATDSEYETSGEPKEPNEKYQQALREWYEQRAKEIKYVYLGKRRAFNDYKNATPDEKARMLIEREEQFYATHKQALNNDYSRTDYMRDNNRAVAQHLDAAVEYAKSVKRPERDNDHAKKTSVTGQLLHEQNTKEQANIANQEFALIKKNLDAKRLLAVLSHSHGVNPEKYPITKGQDGGDRIKAGTRNLNVSDFLTKEIQLDYREAGRILRETYTEQIARNPAANPRLQPKADLWREYQEERGRKAPIVKAAYQQRISEQRNTEATRRQEVKSDYTRKHHAIRTNPVLSQAQRKAAISVARMGKITAENTLRERSKRERDELNTERSHTYRNGYRDFLAARAQNGDEAALSELRKQQARESATPVTDACVIQAGEHQAKTDREAIYRKEHDITYRVHQNGDVIYSRGGREILCDQSKRVKILTNDQETIETGLRMAQAKFGRSLEVYGNTEFKRQTAIVAAEKGINVQFSDKAMNTLMETHRHHLSEMKTRAAEFRILAKLEREKEWASKAEQPKEIEAARPAPEIKRDEEAKHAAINEAIRIMGRADIVVREPSENTQHTGKFLHIDADFAVQAIGTNEVVIHPLNRLDQTPVIGDKATVKYHQGLGKVNVWEIWQEKTEEYGEPRL